MAAPKGNNFWEARATHGRKKIFETPKIMKEAAQQYFQWCIDNPLLETQLVKYKERYETAEIPKMRPFTLIGLTQFLHVNSIYFNRFEEERRKEDGEEANEYCKVIAYIRDVIYNQKFSGAAAGFLNPNIIARDLGLSEKTESKVNITSYDEMTTEEIQAKIDSINSKIG